MSGRSVVASAYLRCMQLFNQNDVPYWIDKATVSKMHKMNVNEWCNHSKQTMSEEMMNLSASVELITKSTIRTDTS